MVELAASSRDDAPARARLPLLTCFGFGVGSIGVGLFSVVPSVLLVYYLTQVVGLSASLAGLAVFLPKAWVVFSDPFVGWWSDRVRGASGRRPFLLAGALLSGSCFALLFRVPELPTHTLLFLTATGLYLLATTSYSLFVVPYLALSAELTQDYQERTRLITFRTMFLYVGVLAGGAVAPVLVQSFGGGRTGYHAMGLILGALCFVAMLASALIMPIPAAGRTAVRRVQHVPFFRLLGANRPYARLLATYWLQLSATGAMLTALPYYIAFNLKQSDSWLGVMFATLTISAMVAMPAISWLARGADKARCWIISTSVFILGVVLLAALAALGTASAWQIIGATIVCGVGSAGLNLFPFAMLPDTLEYHQVTTGEDRSGAFTGVWAASEKAATAVGALVAGLVLDLFGLVPGSATQSAPVLVGTIVAYSVVPIVLFTASIATIARYDLTRARLIGLRGEPAAGQA